MLKLEHSRIDPTVLVHWKFSDFWEVEIKENLSYKAGSYCHGYAEPQIIKIQKHRYKAENGQNLSRFMLEFLTFCEEVKLSSFFERLDLSIDGLPALLLCFVGLQWLT